MGEPKAGVELAGRTLVGRVVAAVGAAGVEPIVVAKPDTPLPRLDCRVLAEPAEPRHPLCGVIAALSASAGRGIVALACDMPLVPAKLIAWLAALEDEAAVCEVDGRMQPLLARYRPSVTERLVEALERRDSMRDAVASLHPRIIAEPELQRFGDPQRIAFNVNDPEDLDQAASLLAGGRGRFRQVLERPGSAIRRAGTR
jgi:molybdopterin-guanine dinucleotide biosynthesis protein A